MLRAVWSNTQCHSSRVFVPCRRAPRYFVTAAEAGAGGRDEADGKAECVRRPHVLHTVLRGGRAARAHRVQPAHHLARVQTPQGMHGGPVAINPR